MPDFAVKTEQPDAETVVIALQGDVDLASAPAFQQELQKGIGLGTSRVVIDLQQATFFDSTALRVLLEGHRALDARNGKIYLVGDNPAIHKIFSITGLDELFPFYATIDQALSSPETFDAVV